MNYEEAIEIINEISARLGATATNLYPKLVKYGIVSNGIEVVAALLMLLVSAFAFKRCWKKMYDEDVEEEGLYPAGFIIAVFGLIFGTVIGFFAIYDLVLWSTVPEIQAIDFILSYK